MIRSKVRNESAAEAEAAVKTLFAALDEQRPQGIRYSSYRLSDGLTYVVLVEVRDGIDNPLTEMPEFRAFQENLRIWLAEPPTPEQVTVVGDYRA